MVSTTDVLQEIIHFGNDNGQLLYGKQILCQFSLYLPQVSNLYADTRLQCLTGCRMGNAGGRAYFTSFPAVDQSSRPAARNIQEIVSIF